MFIRRLFTIRPGQKYNRLTVLVGGPNRSKIKCECECGRIAFVRGDSLRNGNTKSCGCLFSETNRIRAVTHGMRNGADKSLYEIWAAIKDRCLNPNNKRYERYGGRGISIASYWLDDPEAFIKYIKTLTHFDQRINGFSLDRINNDSHYQIGNLRWANSHAQRINR